MNRLLACTALALSLGLVPALAADNAGQLPTGQGVSPKASQQATQPPSGSADQSGGAAEQSSAPPASGAANAKSAESSGMPNNSADPSSGAKEQSSAPPSSSAASTQKPNPTLGTQQQQDTE
jgi:hypothetical protein